MFSLGSVFVAPVVVLSAVFGSFASSLSYRLVEGGVWKIRSFCPICRVALRFGSLVPVLSYIFQRGRCLNCAGRIGFRYLGIELIQIFCGLVALCFARSWYGFVLIFATSFALLVISVVDLADMFVPDSMNFLLFLVAVLAGFDDFFGLRFVDVLAWINAFSFALLKVLYEFLRFKICRVRREVLGWGDVKLVFVLSFLIKSVDFPFFMFFSGFSSCVVCFLILKKKGNLFPFAPFLSVSAFPFVVKGFYGGCGSLLVGG